MKQLTPRQRLFADEYIKTGNATYSAVAAGYSDKYANTNASKLLQNTTIKRYIDQRNQELMNERTADLQEVKEHWTAIMRCEGRHISDRLKASELLARSYGAFLEKPKSEPDNGKLLELIMGLKEV